MGEQPILATPERFIHWSGAPVGVCERRDNRTDAVTTPYSTPVGSGVITFLSIADHPANVTCPTCKPFAQGTAGCGYVYSGRNGGRKGQMCGRPEADHCKGRTDNADDSHDDACKLNFESAAKSRRMVHHPFHRRYKVEVRRA